MTQPQTTLACVVEVLDNMLAVLSAPRGLDVGWSSVAICDPLEDLIPGRSDLVLGIGVDASRASAAQLLDLCAAAGARALVVRASGPVHERVVAHAEEGAVALLRCERSVGWDELVRLLDVCRDPVLPAAGERTGGLAGLASLAQSLTVMTGGETLVEDARHRVVAHAEAEGAHDRGGLQVRVGEQLPTELLESLTTSGVLREVWTAPGVVSVDLGPPVGKGGLAVAVRAGDELLGSVWLLRRRRPLADGSDRALAAVARAGALHLLRERGPADHERQRASDRVLAVLDGTLPPSVVAAQLGQREAAPVAVVALTCPDEGPTADTYLAMSRLSDQIHLFAAAYSRRIACAAGEGVVYVVVPQPASGARDDAPRLAGELVDQAARLLRCQVVAGVGSTVPTMAQLRRSRNEADAVLTVRRERPDLPAVVRIDDVRAHTVLDHLRSIAELDAWLTSGKVAVLVRHDREQRSEYVPTLRAYLDTFGDVRTAAAVLDVHPNTFRYRLRRLRRLAALDLDDPVERLVAHLQLHLLPD